MPKQVSEIKHFSSGIVSTPDAKDIPPDAADYSLNIETIASDGKVMGRKEDRYLASIGGFGATSAGFGNITVGSHIVSAGGGPID